VTELDGMRDLIQTCLDAYARRLGVVMECETLAKARAENNMLRHRAVAAEGVADRWHGDILRLTRERDAAVQALKVTGSNPRVEDSLREQLDLLGDTLGRAFGEKPLAAAVRVMRERDAAVQALEAAAQTRTEEIAEISRLAAVEAKRLAEAEAEQVLGPYARSYVDTLIRDLDELSKENGVDGLFEERDKWEQAARQSAAVVEALQAENRRREADLDRAQERLKRAHSTIREFVYASRRLPRLERQVELLREQNGRLQSDGSLKASHAYISRLNRAQYASIQQTIDEVREMQKSKVKSAFELVAEQLKDRKVTEKTSEGRTVYEANESVPVRFEVKAQGGQGEAELRLVKDEADNE